jgi:predicted nucleotidyltransferase
LNVHRVKYLLIGGYAVGYYGYARTTMDMDIWIALDPGNAKKMVAVFSQFGFPPGAIDTSAFLDKARIIRLGLPPVRLEIMTDISGIEFSACYARRKRATFDGVRLNLIGFDDLIKNKKASGRHKDLADLEYLSDLRAGRVTRGSADDLMRELTEETDGTK